MNHSSYYCPSKKLNNKNINSQCYIQFEFFLMNKKKAFPTWSYAIMRSNRCALTHPNSSHSICPNYSSRSSTNERITRLSYVCSSSLPTRAFDLLISFIGKIANFKKLDVPENPAYSTPGRILLFYFFWALRPRYYVQQCIFFSTISGPFSHNLDRDIGTRSHFFEFFFVFFWLYSTGITGQNII